MAVIIKNGKTYGDRSVSLTQAEYNALSETEKNNGTVYYIYDVNAVPQASDVVYDNTESGLNASNVQGAIDEVSKGLAQIKYVTIAVSSRSVESMRRTYHEFTIPDGYIPIGSHYVGTDDSTMSSIICGNVARVFNTDLNTHTANGTIYVVLAPYSAN